MVLTFHTDRLSTLPLSWYSLMDAPKDARVPRRPATLARDRAGVTPVFNTHADRLLMQRFQESGHRNV